MTEREKPQPVALMSLLEGVDLSVPELITRLGQEKMGISVSLMGRTMIVDGEGLKWGGYPFVMFRDEPIPWNQVVVEPQYRDSMIRKLEFIKYSRQQSNQ